MIAATQPRPARRRASVIIVVIIAVALVVTAGVLVALKPWQASPLTLANGKAHISYGMSRTQIENQIGASNGTMLVHVTKYDGVGVGYRNDEAVYFFLGDGSPFNINGITVGINISEVRKKFPTLYDWSDGSYAVYFEMTDGKWVTCPQREATSAPTPGLVPPGVSSLTTLDYLQLGFMTAGSDAVTAISLGDLQFVRTNK